MFLRSSSIGSFRQCEHKFLGEYVIGFTGKTGAAACQGNCVHKVLEGLGHRKLCQQNGTTHFNDDLLGNVRAEDCTPEWLIPRVIDAYSRLEPHLTFDKSVVTLIEKLVNKTLTYNDGAFNPLTMTIVHPELPFDIEIDKPWAYYDYEFKGEKIQGFLRIKGTMDLIAEESPNVYHMYDWKSGRMSNWATGKEKNFDNLQYDDQLLLYYYALRTLFPHLKQIIVTIFFIKHQPFTMCFDDRHYIRAEKMIKSVFEQIKSIEIPALNVNFRCKWCPLYAQFNNTSKSICQTIRESVLQDGLQKTTEKYIQRELGAYGQGGGRGQKS